MSKLDDTITALTSQVAANKNAEQSALKLIQAIPGLITTAVAAAQAAGATPAQLQSFTDLTASLKANDDELAAAVIANTPAATP